MLYFDNSKNRNVLALLFTCFALLECIFFGYALSELYSFLYPSMLHIISVFIISCFSYFLDFKRKMNAVFIFGGIIIEAVFVSLSYLYFSFGSEEGFYRIPTSDYLSILLPVLLTHTACVLCSGILRIKSIDRRLICLITAVIYMAFCFVYHKSGILYALITAAICLFSHFYLDHLNGDNAKLSKSHILLLFGAYIICMILFFLYQDGILLTQEATSFVNLLLIFTGLLLALFKKRFGLYLVEFISIYMALAYILYRAETDTVQSLQSLFGIVPVSVIGAAALYVNISIDKKKHMEG